MSTKHNRKHWSVLLFTRLLALVLSIATFSVYLTAPNSAAEPLTRTASATVIASGLHNPRGLNFAPDGSLYVVEAGADSPSPGPCGLHANGAPACYAQSGSITRIDITTGSAERIIDSLPSLIAPSGDATTAFGVHDISFQGLGNAYVTVGLEANPATRVENFGAAGRDFARLARFNPSGKFSFEEDLGEYEVVANPDGHAVPDSNPYGLLALPGKVIYTDASGNCLNQVKANGEISTLAVFPDRMITRPNGSTVSVQAVPTTVALGPDGDLYVGQLTGFPFTVGIANVYRVPIQGGTPVVAYSGFTNIIDIAFAGDGTLYVLEIARSGLAAVNIGRLVQIAPDGTRTEILTPGELRAPGGIAIGSDGALYVTNRSVSSTIGHVLRIEL
ncbi:MAG: ScyD/ScyE family protein [Pyrinomonadaceae bacterium]